MVRWRLGVWLACAACGGNSAASVDAPAGTADAAIDASSSVPPDPIAYTPDQPFELVAAGTTSYVDVPASYDGTHHTPTTLLVWAHGCGGLASGDIWVVSPAGRSWISLALGGQEGACWDVDHDSARALAAIDEVARHFNIAPKRVVMGGYSSGGDLTYRTAFYAAARFAGVIVMNSSPFRDTNSSANASIAAASWRFHVAHLAHLQDTTYPIAGVRTETDALTTAGFPMTRVEVDGGHWDDAGAIENGHAVPGTDADLATYLLPKLDDGWVAP